ncbi:hypothetical protein GQ44DRAFT_159216 [Phaeosphaeriaceae sp. PMI808]|nr:hypothetical protein GQ44DRAFT_159216 [Phaeosphaeriaceae sp. PMI808]
MSDLALSPITSALSFPSKRLQFQPFTAGTTSKTISYRISLAPLEFIASAVSRTLSPGTPGLLILNQQEKRTGGWILNEALFRKWSDFATPRLSKSPLGDVLWIRGNPGYGKTVLAASTLEAFKNDERFHDTNTCYYFFHTEPGSTALSRRFVPYNTN